METSGSRILETAAGTVVPIVRVVRLKHDALAVLGGGRGGLVEVKEAFAKSVLLVPHLRAGRGRGSEGFNRAVRRDTVIFTVLFRLLICWVHHELIALELHAAHESTLWSFNLVE